MLRAFAITLLLTVALGCSPTVVDITGVYKVTGSVTYQGQSKEYSNKVQISKDPEYPDTYNLVWVEDNSAGQLIAIGKGYLHGDTLVVIINNQGVIELASYKVQGQKLLLGHWVVPGESGIMNENLEKTNEDPFAVMESPDHEHGPQPTSDEAIQL